MAKNKKKTRAEQGGFRPTNVGYSAEEDPRYVRKFRTGNLPKAPIGGTGEISRAPSPAGTAKHEQ
jgi:hypothetical protein